jgi:hypothetical protein
MIMKTTLEEFRATPAERTRPEAAGGVLTREQLVKRYREVRDFSEALCKPLRTEDYAIQSMPDASPAKWHLAHTSWFFETFVLKPGLPRYQEYDPHNAYLFNSYYNAVGPMHCRARRGMISRPTVEETYRYREQVDSAMTDFFESAPEDHWRELEPVVVLGLNHEQQHQELFLTDIKHMFAQNPLYPAYGPTVKVQAPATALRWVSFPECIYWIGHEGGDFCFDNEGPRHRVFLENFQLASRLVTNAEYLRFVEDGGYERPEFWLSLGWLTVNEQKWKAPLYWEKREGKWLAFTLSGLREVWFRRNPSAMSVTSRLMLSRAGRVRGCQLRPSGKLRQQMSNWPAISLRNSTITRSLAAKRDTANSRRCSAMFGNGREAPTLPIRGTKRPKGPSANTMASSCATSTCCVGGRAPHRRRTFAALTATFSRPINAGSLWESGLRGTPYDHPHRQKGSQ